MNLTIKKALTCLGLVLLAALVSPSALAIGNCPPIGFSSSCSVLITIQPDGRLTFQTDPTVPPYDGIEDVLVGVINRSGATIFGISLSGSGIFGFDGDGAFAGDYAGPGTSFSVVDANKGTVNFPAGLDDGRFIYFSLEGAPSQIKLSATVTVDPGHGTSCPAKGLPGGAVGTRSFPPIGVLKEDNLTVDTASQVASLLSADGYTVAQTKTSVEQCPTYEERGQLANDERSNVFVSIHYDAPSLIFFHGSLGLYNPTKDSASTLARKLADATSASLGVGNRGIEARPNLAVLKPTVTRMTAAIIEVARLSSPDDLAISAPGGTSRAASGIKVGIDGFVNP